MIQDKREIQIKSSPVIIFDLIETMPLFFLRVFFVDGLHTAIKAVGVDQYDDVLILKVGDSMGPFTLTESERPFRYWFTLKSFFFNCRTGYSLSTNGSETILNFDLISENPSFMEKVYWFLIKPFHGIFSNKVLLVIKERVENQGHNFKSSVRHNTANSADVKNRAAD